MAVDCASLRRSYCVKWHAILCFNMDFSAKNGASLSLLAGVCLQRLMFFITYVNFTVGLIHRIGSCTQAASGPVRGRVRLLVFTVVFIKLKHAAFFWGAGNSLFFSSLSLTLLFLDSVPHHLAVFSLFLLPACLCHSCPLLIHYCSVHWSERRIHCLQLRSVDTAAAAAALCTVDVFKICMFLLLLLLPRLFYRK